MGLRHGKQTTDPTQGENWRIERWRNSRRREFGYISLSTLPETGEAVTKKRIYFSNTGEGVPCSVIREVSLLRELGHDNIIRLEGVEDTEMEEYVDLLFEHLDDDLQHYIHTNSRIQNDRQQWLRVTKSYLFQILSGLAYCHAHKILHRQVKPYAIFIDESKGIVKLANFVDARAVGVPSDNLSGQLTVSWYEAPEILLGSTTYSFPIDVWGVGCIFAEMVSGEVLFSGTTKSDVRYKVFRILGLPNEETWPEVSKLPGWHKVTKLLGLDFKPPALVMESLASCVPDLDTNGLDLLSKLLCLSPHDRITARDALAHPYFNQLRDELGSSIPA